MTTDVEVDDDLRRRVLEQLCKGRSMAFAAGNVASLIRDVMPGHRPGTCLDCRRARA